MQAVVAGLHEQLNAKEILCSVSACANATIAAWVLTTHWIQSGHKNFSVVSQAHSFTWNYCLLRML